MGFKFLIILNSLFSIYPQVHNIYIICGLYLEWILDIKNVAFHFMKNSNLLIQL